MKATRRMREGHLGRYFPPKISKPEPAAFLGPYQWLMLGSIPHMVNEAISLWRAIEAIKGTTAEAISTAEVAAALHGDTVSSRDPVARAGLVLAVLARRARRSVPETPQCALDWANYGTAAGQPRLGDILCLLSEDGAYVGLYIGEDAGAFHCLGVTYDDRIGIQRLAKTKLYTIRRPLYDCVRISAHGIHLNQDGTPAPEIPALENGI